MNFLMELWNVFCFLFLGFGSLFSLFFFVGCIVTSPALIEAGYSRSDIFLVSVIMFILSVIFIALFKVKFL